MSFKKQQCKRGSQVLMRFLVAVRLLPLSDFQTTRKQTEEKAGMAQTHHSDCVYCSTPYCNCRCFRRTGSQEEMWGNVTQAIAETTVKNYLTPKSALLNVCCQNRRTNPSSPDLCPAGSRPSELRRLHKCTLTSVTQPCDTGH